MASNYSDVLKGESLSDFLSTLRDFDHDFCDAMVSGADFTLKLEIRGDNGKLLHARITSDVFRRPNKNSKDSI